MTKREMCRRPWPRGAPQELPRVQPQPQAHASLNAGRPPVDTPRASEQAGAVLCGAAAGAPGAHPPARARAQPYAVERHHWKAPYHPKLYPGRAIPRGCRALPCTVIGCADRG